MRPAVLTIRRTDLVKHEACAAWLAMFDAVCLERDTDRVRVGTATDAAGRPVGIYECRTMYRGPLIVRRSGTTYRDRSRLRIVLTPLAQVWLCLPLPDGGSAWEWLRARGAVGAASAPRADLSGANLYGANLSRANLLGADLSRANLLGADLYGANLSRANLYGANLYGANLSRADLSGANLYGADLYGANLYGADLYGANLSGANLSGANLSGANLSGADRSGDDAVIAGWAVRDGRMERAS